MTTLQEQLKIISQVKEYCDERNLLPALIAENGSHAWGYADENSDHDVKVMFLHQPEEYKKFNHPKDCYTYQADAMHDYTFWDIRKVLELLMKGNAQVYELFYSPFIYTDTTMSSLLRPIVKSICEEQLKPIAYHYYGLAYKTYKERIREVGEPTAKKYLYVLRPLLHAESIIYTQTLPPLNFDDCLENAEDNISNKVLGDIREILDLKKSGRLLQAQKRYEDLDNFIEWRLDCVKKELETFAPAVKYNKVNIQTRVDELYKLICHSSKN